MKFQESVFRNYLEQLIQIDSVSGFHEEIQKYIEDVLTGLGVTYDIYYKGGIVAHVDGSGSKAAILAHIDTIGMMVRNINSDGTLEVCPVGGLCPVYEVTGDVVIHNISGQCFTGTIQKKNSSTHLMNSTEIFRVDPNDCIVCLDEAVSSRSDTAALGIRVGDMIAPVPRFQSTKDGYIKSRFLDDKASVAILLALLHDIVTNQTPVRKTDFYFTAFEETGHGASLLPEDVRDVIVLEIAMMGKSQASNERQVSIYPKYGTFLSNRTLLKQMINCAEKNNIPYTLDVLLSGGNDANSAIVAGKDVRHCVLGFGTLASHGYERTHIDGIKATYDLVYHWIAQSL